MPAQARCSSLTWHASICFAALPGSRLVIGVLGKTSLSTISNGIRHRTRELPLRGGEMGLRNQSLAPDNSPAGDYLPEVIYHPSPGDSMMVQVFLPG
jgi:hypothetical protein